MAIYNTPNSRYESVQVNPRKVTSATTSPFTLETQTIRHQGNRWEFSVTVAPHNYLEAREWYSFFNTLDGGRHSFNLDLTEVLSPKGTNYPNVGGISVGATSLTMSGLPLSTNGIYLAGDHFNLIDVGSPTNVHELFTSLEDVDSDGAGEATISFWPPTITAEAVGEDVKWNSAKVTCKLMGEPVWEIYNDQTTRFSFECYSYPRAT